jgi:hypothetical protein
MGIRFQPHRLYKKFLPQWQRCRDVALGEDAVKAKGELYLPPLSGHREKPESYIEYLQGAYYFNGTGRTVQGFKGMIFRKPGILEVPGALEPLLDDVTGTGVSWDSFTEKGVQELLTVSRGGILVDFRMVDEALGTDERRLSVAEAEELGMRPYMSWFLGENILNWRRQRVGAATVLTMVVLRDFVETDGEEQFETGLEERRRVLLLRDGAYEQRLFRKERERIDDGDGGDEVFEFDTWVQDGPTVKPQMNGLPLTEIPFIFLNPEDTSADPSKPVMLDMCNTNLAHYRNSANHEHGLLFTGNPQPVVAGYKSPKGEPISLGIGSSEAWVFPQPDTRAYYMEFHGQGLKPLSDAMADKKREMVVLGARMLSDEKKGVEAAETVRLNKQGENSILGALANAASRGFTQALRIFAAWAGDNPESVEFELNRDFFPLPMDSKMVTALIEAMQEGEMIAPTDVHKVLQRGELIERARTREDVEREIDEMIKRQAERNAALPDQMDDEGNEGEGEGEGEGGEPTFGDQGE